MQLSRRSAVYGGTLVIGAAVAGCLDIIEQSQDGDRQRQDDGEQPHADAGDLRVRNIRLLSEAPQGYREYQPVEDREFPQTESPWLYFEPRGVTTEPAEEGAVHIELSTTLEVTHRDETVTTVEETFRREVPEQDINELFLYFQFAPQETSLRPGRYGATLSVTDERADETTAADTAFTVAGDDRHDPGIEHVRFVEDPPTGYREYNEVSEPVYRRDDQIWLYIEPVGVAIEDRDGEPHVEFDASATVTGPDGESVGRVSESFTAAIPDEEHREELFVVFDLDLRRPQLGEHTVKLTIRDQVRRGRASETVSFQLDDPELEYVEAFRGAVKAETEITIDRLTLVEDGRMLRLTYQSAYTYDDDPEGFGGEVGAICGAYAGLIEEGFSTDRLLVSGEDQEETEFSYSVSSDLARQYMNDEITSEEFVERVLRRTDL